MYSSQPAFILGFHGCDASLAKRVIAGEINLSESNESYDWLGHGIYFWEGNPERAMQWAEEKKARTTSKTKNGVKEPAVIGAVIDLGNCLNLLDSKSLGLVKTAYNSLQLLFSKIGEEMPTNMPLPGKTERVLHHLDCAVIQHLHTARKDERLEEFHSVRGAFIEGKELFTGSEFRDKNHIQICVRNPNCIKGYFMPRQAQASYPIP